MRKQMKQLTSLILAGVLTGSLAGCMPNKSEQPAPTQVSGFFLRCPHMDGFSLSQSFGDSSSHHT